MFSGSTSAFSSSRTITNCPGLMAPDIMSGSSWVRLVTERNSAPVPSILARTLMRTLSQASPSIRSSPPRPSIMSLPSPPRMMLPAPNEVTSPSAPNSGSRSLRNCCRPSIRKILVSTLPYAPCVAIAAALASSPRRMSLRCDPDSPSTASKRASTDAPDAGIGASSKARRVKSTLAPNGSSRNTAQSKPDIPT
ncbi:hypothetical protein D9M68_777380 [compost metagenome]